MFAKYPPLGEILITMYGSTPEAYFKVSRVKDGYEKVVNGMELLYKYGINFRVRGVLLAGIEDSGENYIHLQKLIPGFELEMEQAEVMTMRLRHDSKPKNKKIESLRLAPEQYRYRIGERGEGYYELRKEFCSKFIGPGGDKLFTCHAGAGWGAIDPYGKLYPCLILMSPEVKYDLREGSLRDAFENFYPKMRTWEAKDEEFKSTCSNCFLHGLCESCPARSFAEVGHMDRRIDYFCDVAHEEAKGLGLISDNEKAWEVKDWEVRVGRKSTTSDSLIKESR